MNRPLLGYGAGCAINALLVPLFAWHHNIFWMVWALCWSMVGLATAVGYGWQ